MPLRLSADKRIHACIRRRSRVAIPISLFANLLEGEEERKATSGGLIGVVNLQERDEGGVKLRGVRNCCLRRISSDWQLNILIEI